MNSIMAPNSIFIPTPNPAAIHREEKGKHLLSYW